MNIEYVRSFCLAKPGVEETFPFDEVTLVFKVLSKAFLLTGLDQEDFRINLKCDPERAIELREEYEDIIPGWHMNKKHWNTVYCERSLDDQLILDLIDHSYDLVVSNLSRKVREQLL